MSCAFSGGYFAHKNSPVCRFKFFRWKAAAYLFSIAERSLVTLKRGVGRGWICKCPVVSRGFWFNLKRSTKSLLAICCITFQGGGLFQCLKDFTETQGFYSLNSSCLGNIIFCIKGVGTQSTQFGCAPELFGMDGFSGRNQWVLRSLIWRYIHQYVKKPFENENVKL